MRLLQVTIGVADIINNDKLFIMYRDWLYPPDMYIVINTWHMFAMIDT